MRSAQPPLAFGLGEHADQIGQRAEVDALAGLDRLDPQRRGQMALAGAGRAEEVHHLAAGDEAELRQRQDAVAVERGLEGEVKARQGLDRRQPRHAQSRS